MATVRHVLRDLHFSKTPANIPKINEALELCLWAVLDARIVPALSGAVAAAQQLGQSLFEKSCHS